MYNPINLNLYHYGGNNPLRMKDPDGRESEEPTLAEQNQKENQFLGQLDSGIKQASDKVFEKHPMLGLVKPVLNASIFQMTKNKLRNELNTDTPETVGEAGERGWDQLSPGESALHQNNKKSGEYGEGNLKFVDPNGKRETVFYGNGEVNDTPEDRGTYNYGEWPKIDTESGNILHRVKNNIRKLSKFSPHVSEDYLPHIILGGPGS